MSPYHLVKLVDWAGELNSRKRLQKVVYLLQAAGCQLDADFILHHYGPYSHEVAGLSDQMVQSGLLAERAAANQVGIQYSYGLTERARELVRDLELSPRNRPLVAHMVQFESKARELLGADLKELEIGSTLVFFLKQGHPWNEAVQKTCQFKKVKPESELVQRAEILAATVVKRA